jgi:hypothetical protein
LRQRIDPGRGVGGGCARWGADLELHDAGWCDDGLLEDRLVLVPDKRLDTRAIDLLDDILLLIVINNTGNGNSVFFVVMFSFNLTIHIY